MIETEIKDGTEDYIPIRTYYPGMYIIEEILEREISLNRLRITLNMPVTDFILLMSGEIPLDPDIAEKLSNAFGTTKEYWIALDHSYQTAKQNLKIVIAEKKKSQSTDF